MNRRLFLKVIKKIWNLKIDIIHKIELNIAVKNIGKTHKYSLRDLSRMINTYYGIYRKNGKQFVKLRYSDENKGEIFSKIKKG